MKILNISFPQMGIEPKSYRVYSQTYVSSGLLYKVIYFTSVGRRRALN